MVSGVEVSVVLHGNAEEEASTASADLEESSGMNARLCVHTEAGHCPIDVFDHPIHVGFTQLIATPIPDVPHSQFRHKAVLYLELEGMLQPTPLIRVQVEEGGVMPLRWNVALKELSLVEGTDVTRNGMNGGTGGRTGVGGS